MTPVNSDTSFPAVASGQITWNGKPIPCLGICSGDKLNNIVYLLATKICQLTEPTDLSNLTLQCALDIFDKDEVGNRTLISVLQLLIDNECDLKTLISSIQAQIAGLSTHSLVLNLGCLIENYTDQYGQPLPYTQTSILQDLINKICIFENEIESIVSTLDTVSSTLVSHINNHPSPTEIQITTCISNTVLPTSQAVIALAADYCDWKAHFGTIAQVQTAISRQTSEINTKMQAVQGWILNPVTAMQSLNNLWIYERYNDDRITLIENNCCKVTCKDILIGFNVITNDDGTISLAFLSMAGTDIPSGFVDKGSTLTIKDKNGVSLNYNLAIAQEATVGEFSISGLDTSANLTISIQALLGTSTLECQKCISKQFAVSNSKCCVLTNDGVEDITIMYTI